MRAESGHHRTHRAKYTIVILPAEESATPKRVTLGPLGIAGFGVGIIMLAIAVVLGALIFTPIGVYVPIPNPELENRYNKQIVAVQERLMQLTEDLVFLREYNIRLRKAMGESLSSEDSTFIASQPLARRRERGPRSTAVQDEEAARMADGPAARLETGQGASFAVKAVQIDLPLTLPVRGYITQDFKPAQQHFGLDFAGKAGSNIYAAADGSVIFAGWTYEDGYMIMLAHGSGYRTTYKHNQALLKATGEYVRRGELIALLGNTGKLSYGPHLHFEVWRDGMPQDPRNYLLTMQ